MMYVIFNYDGSINKKFLDEFVMQGNSYENVLFVAFIDRQPSEYTLYANFKLPNGDTNIVDSTLNSNIGTETIDGVEYNGEYISLTQDQTLLAGVLRINIKCLTTDTEKVLVSFTTYLTINETGIQPDDPVIITSAEYQYLLSLLGTQVVNYETIYRTTSILALGDLSNWREGQAIYLKNESEAKIYEITGEHTAVLVVDLLKINQSVLFVEQSLNSSQQKRARDNIDAKKVSVSSSGTSQNVAKYITIESSEYRLEDSHIEVENIDI